MSATTHAAARAALYQARLAIRSAVAACAGADSDEERASLRPEAASLIGEVRSVIAALASDAVESPP